MARRLWWYGDFLVSVFALAGIDVTYMRAYHRTERRVPMLNTIAGAAISAALPTAVKVVR
jgi:hypothetical protein